ncbi:Retrovirus-related Pol polyprotein from transposon TNT 1-94, partial [Durusdinium trenchii]
MEKVQSVIPEMQVQLMISCRGTDRYRTPDKQDDSSRLTLRKTVYIHRVSGAFVDVGVPEEWQKLSRMKRERADIVRLHQNLGHPEPDLFRKDDQGQVRDEVLKEGQGPRDFVALDEFPEAGDMRTVPSVTEEDQPELEVSPPSTLGTEPMEPEREGLSEYAPTDPPDVEMDGVNIPVPEEVDDDLFAFGDDTFLSLGSPEYEFSFRDGPVLGESQRDTVFSVWETFGVTNAKKEKVELRWDDLSEKEKVLFRAAKEKEVKAWLSHQTVKRVAQGTLKPEEIMRCRWILTWKPPESPGGERRAKARLVILGFTDPGISYVPNDAPTLSKDGRMLVVQGVSSFGWDLVSFDVSTAFLKGEGDGRNLGIQAPPEIATSLNMSRTDQCQLL